VDLYGLSESKEIQLRRNAVDYFLHLLFSNSSTSVDYVEPIAWGVTLRLWGPVTDDQGRLSTQCRMKDWHLHDLLPIKEERYAVVRRLHELGVGGKELKDTCKSLRVSRLGLC
jgi:hypothetical protein